MLRISVSLTSTMLTSESVHMLAS